MSQIYPRNSMARSLWAAAILNVGITVVHLLAWVILPFDSQESVTAAWQIFLGFQAVSRMMLLTGVAVAISGGRHCCLLPKIFAGPGPGALRFF
jgi:hypothetical protein